MTNNEKKNLAKLVNACMEPDETQAEFAKRTGVNISIISRVRRGEYDPGAKTLMKFAKVAPDETIARGFYALAGKPFLGALSAGALSAGMLSEAGLATSFGLGAIAGAVPIVPSVIIGAALAKAELKKQKKKDEVVGTIRRYVSDNHIDESAALVEDVRNFVTTTNADTPQTIPDDKDALKFKTLAWGLIVTKLAMKGISFVPQSESIFSDVYNVDAPENVITLSDQSINEWWFYYFRTNELAESELSVSSRLNATLALAQFISLDADPARQITLVVNDQDLFDCFCEMKQKNSLKGNLSVLLMDEDSVNVTGEVVVATYDDNANPISLL